MDSYEKVLELAGQICSDIIAPNAEDVDHVRHQSVGLLRHNRDQHISFHHHLYRFFYDVLGTDLLGDDIGNFPEHHSRESGGDSGGCAMDRQFYGIGDLPCTEFGQHYLYLLPVRDYECLVRHLCLEDRS